MPSEPSPTSSSPTFGAYWGRVVARSARETVTASSWSSVPKFLAITAAALILTSWTWGQTHNVPRSIIATFAGAAVALVLTFTFKLTVLPPRLARKDADRIAELEATLATFNPAGPDASVWHAIAYAFTGQWEPAKFWEADLGSHLESLHEVVDALEERAHNGLIHIWGRPSGSGRPVQVPAEFWTHGKIDVQGMVSNPNSPPWTRKYGAFDPSHYVDLQVNKAEIEREWPHPPGAGTTGAP